MSKPLRLKLKQRWLPFVYGYLAKFFLKILGYTCRYQIEGLDNFLAHAGKNKCILMLWHNRIVMLPEIIKRSAPTLTYAALISKSRDGEIISTFTNSFPNGKSIRVAHNAKSDAIETMVDELKSNNSVLIITPDGPRGPKYKVKTGICRVANSAKATVVPMSWQSSHFWTLKSWDKLVIPKPFSKIYAKFGEPVQLDGQEIQEGSKILEEALFGLF